MGTTLKEETKVTSSATDLIVLKDENTGVYVRNPASSTAGSLSPRLYSYVVETVTKLQ